MFLYFGMFSALVMTNRLFGSIGQMFGRLTVNWTPTFGLNE